MSLAQAQRAMEAADEAARKFESLLEADKDAAMRASEELIDKALAARREKLIELRQAAYAAQSTWHEEKVADARRTAGKDGNLALGTRMFEWENGRSYFGSRDFQWSKTGRTGIIQVWTPETKHPENLRWGLPNVGDLYIRVLKVDGTESLKFESLRGNYKSTWMPEGKKPGRG
jgi:hypothetical protein